MGWGEITGLVLTFVAGGGIVSVVTVGGKKRKADCEAKAAELENVQEAIGIWREMSDRLLRDLDESRERMGELAEQVDELRGEVARLRQSSERIATLINRMTCENCIFTREEIRKSIIN